MNNNSYFVCFFGLCWNLAATHVDASSIMTAFEAKINATHANIEQAEIQKSSFLGSLTSWIDSAELRAGTDNQVNSSKKYALRLRPKSGGHRLAERSLRQLNKDSLLLNYKITLNAELKNIYMQMIQILRQQFITDSAYRLRNLSQIKLNYHKGLVQSASFSAAKLQQAELNATKSEAISSINNEVFKSMLKNYGYEEYSNLTTTGWEQWGIPFEKLEPLLKKNLKELEANENLLFSNELLNLEIARTLMQEARKERSLALGFVEVEYDDLSAVMGYSIGINLPLGGGASSMARRDLSYRRLQMEVAQKKLDFESKRKVDEIEVQRLIMLWKAAKLEIDEIQKRLHTAKKMLGTDLVLDLEQKLIEEKQEIQNIYFDILEHHITFLSHSGELSTQPPKNWLHKELSTSKD